MTYWRKINNLSATITTNWLLDEAPDIYLYGCLLESAPYLKDDERLGTWMSLYESRVEKLWIAEQDKQFGGSIQRVYTPIG